MASQDSCAHGITRQLRAWHHKTAARMASQDSCAHGITRQLRAWHHKTAARMASQDICAHGITRRSPHRLDPSAFSPPPCREYAPPYRVESQLDTSVTEADEVPDCACPPSSVGVSGHTKCKQHSRTHPRIAKRASQTGPAEALTPNPCPRAACLEVAADVDGDAPHAPELAEVPLQLHKQTLIHCVCASLHGLGYVRAGPRFVDISIQGVRVWLHKLGLSRHLRGPKPHRVIVCAVVYGGATEGGEGNGQRIT
jgi:hypothetical protein